MTTLTTEDLIHLEFIHNRLIDVYGESRNTDFVKKLLDIINTSNTVSETPKKKTRYFFVSFHGADCSGSVNFKCDGFPSNKNIKENLVKLYPKADNPTIMNIYEFKTKSDFDSFNLKT